MDSIARAMLLREAVATTRMSLGRRVVAGLLGVDLQDHHNQGENMAAERDYAVAPGEYVTEWLEENDISMQELAFALGVNETYAWDLIAGKVPVSEEIAAALEKLTGIPVKQWAVLDATYWKDRARLAKIDVGAIAAARRDTLLAEIVDEDQALLDRLAPDDAKRVREGIAAAKDGTFKGVEFDYEEPLVNRLADER